MRSGIAVAAFCILFAIAFASLAFAPQQGNKQKKEQERGNQSKGNKQDRSNQGNSGNQGNNGKNQGNRGNQDDKSNKGNSNKNKPVTPGDDGPGKSENAGRKDQKVKVKDDGTIVWDRETFRDRKQVRKGAKITICHKFNRDGDPGVTISVSENAWKAHQAHGDVLGTCPAVSNGRFSDIFTRRRNDYYETIANGQDQVLYSRSILDYALERLAASRLQLDRYRNSGMPADELRRKEDAVLQLEQNTSLLETLLLAGAALISDKF